MRQFLLLAIVIIVLIGGIWFSKVRKEPFHVSGLIEAEEIRVGSRVGGRVLRVFASEGSKVTTGSLLVEFEAYDLKERRAQALAGLSAKKARLAKLETGFRPEEIGQTKAQREQLAAQLAKLEKGPRKQEIAAAKARLAQALAELELAKLTHARTQKLLKGKAAPPEEFDRAQRQLKVSAAVFSLRQAELALLIEGTRKEDVDQAKARLDGADYAWQLQKNGYRKEEVAEARAAVEASKAAIKVIEQQLDELTVKAPMSAVVETISLQKGDIVGPSVPVASLTKKDFLWVRAYVPENRLTFPLGHEVTVTVDSFPKERFKGKVTFIAHKAEFTPANVQTPEERSKQVFRIKVTILDGLQKLRPGMSADIWFKELRS